MAIPGGRYDFDDGGAFCGGWEDGKAHGPGVCTGPKGMGEFSGTWAYGFEASGVYLWPSGNMYEGQWTQGKRHGTGVERKDKWTYKGEWTQGFKGRYGVRSSVSSGAKYEGTWTTGLQDGYGSETYADGGTYQGQWLRGLRHGFGVRTSVPYGCAAQYRHGGIHPNSVTSAGTESPLPIPSTPSSLRSPTHTLSSPRRCSAEEEDTTGTMRQSLRRNSKMDRVRGGFVLAGKSDAVVTSAEEASGAVVSKKSSSSSLFDKPKSLKRSLMKTLKKQRSAGDISDRGDRYTMSTRSTRSVTSQRSSTSVESAISTLSKATDCSDHSFYSQDDITDVNVIETYRGEWKGDKRSGFGICDRTDGLRYEGEWHNNKKYGYGVTTLKDGTREEGKYKNNVLVTSGRRNKLFVLQKTKLRERTDEAVLSAQRAAQLAVQKADIAVSRMANAKAKAELAAISADQAQRDSDHARLTAKYLDPSFKQPGTLVIKKMLEDGVGYHQLHHNTSGVSDSGHRSHGDRAPPLNRRYQSLDKPGGPDRGDKGRLAGLSASLEENHVDNHRTQPSNDPLYNRTDLMNSSTLTDRFDHYSAPKPDINHNTGGMAIGAAGPSKFTSKPSRFASLPRSNPSVPYIPPDNPPIGSLQRPSKYVPASTAVQEPSIGPARVSSYANTPSPPTAPSISPRTGGGVPLARPAVGNGGIHGAGAASGSNVSPLRPPPASSSLNSQSADDTLLPNRITQRKVAAAAASPVGASASGLSASGKRGSMPDLANTQDLAGMSKGELMQLSARRRDDIRRLLDEEEKRKAGDLGVLVSDVKKWVQQRQLMMLVVALNVSLASVIYNLMT